MKKYWFGLIMVCMILYGCADGLKDMEASYTVKVTGTGQMKFSGHYTFASTTGLQKPAYVEGIVPAEYKGKGIAAVCVFRKTTAEGTLKVSILKDDKIISEAETAEPFGIISQGKAPDANSIINRILGIILG